MRKIEKIKQEIERLQRNLNECISPNNPILPGTLNVTFDRLKDFIDSLQDEPVNEDLEEAAYKHHVEQKTYYFYDSFKAGAEWQKQQMMKDAVEAKVSFGQIVLQEKPIPTSVANDGDCIKIIILKAE